MNEQFEKELKAWRNWAVSDKDLLFSESCVSDSDWDTERKMATAFHGGYHSRDPEIAELESQNRQLIEQLNGLIKAAGVGDE